MWLYSSIYFHRSFVVQLLSCVQFFTTPWTAACQAFLSFTISQSCSNSSALIRWCHPSISFSVILFSSCPQSFAVSQSFPVSQLFASGGQSIEASSSPSVLPIEYSGLISFKINWFALTAFQGILKNLLQHHRSKASILQHSAFFMILFSHLYMTDYWKNHSFDYKTFVGKVMSLLLNTLSRFVVAFLSRSNFLLILWPQSSYTVTLENLPLFRLFS